jgi:hypothetical protein
LKSSLLFHFIFLEIPGRKCIITDQETDLGIGLEFSGKVLALYAQGPVLMIKKRKKKKRARSVAQTVDLSMVCLIPKTAYFSIQPIRQG